MSAERRQGTPGSGMAAIKTSLDIEDSVMLEDGG